MLCIFKHLSINIIEVGRFYYLQCFFLDYYILSSHDINTRCDLQHGLKKKFLERIKPHFCTLGGGGGSLVAVELREQFCMISLVFCLLYL